MEPLIINAAITGMVPMPRDNASVPITVAQVIAEARRCAAAGIGRFQFPINTLALAMGGHVRVGLEDNLWMDAERTDPATNVRLIERVVRVAQAAGRAIATPARARQIIGMNQPN